MAKYKAYPEYKDSGVEWLGAIPEHWKISKFRYQFVFGKGLTITKEHLQDEGIPCVNYGEVHSKYGFEVDPEIHTLKCVSDKYLKDNSNSLLAKGDIVFADTSEDIDGSGNFTQLVSDIITFAGYHTIIARPFERNNSRFYAYLLDCKELRSQVRHAVKGVKVFSVTQAILRNLSIWLPSKDEQAQISSFLDHETAKIDSLIEKQRQLIELLKEKRQAVISHAVTKGLNPDVPMKDSGVEWLGKVPEHWAILPLQRLLKKIEQGSSPVAQNRVPENGEYGVLKISSIKNGVFISHEVKTLDSVVQYEKRFKVKRGDLLVTRANTPNLVADSCVVDIVLSHPVMMSDLIYRLDTTNMVNKNFLCLWLLSNFGRLQVKMDARGSSMSMAKVSQEHIKSWLTVLPPLKEQLEINLFLNAEKEKLLVLISKAELAINILQERRTALISAAVTGKIDVRDWVAPDTQNVEEPQEATA
ncbi:restriction endonuclease subunit S [Leclercia adecarboxylata]|uniref:restriction endonuclease subunit S n=1 Tax=Leclercia adecarboxylata TaxID=83655 RepID=UPI001E59F987|nr:restriction endonuclease subunit S [Leclercia adecarboxylata]UFM68982.1 restriction endonuclease subunit S [Leclercia adecarboxylata]